MNSQDKIKMIKYVMLALADLIMFGLFLASSAFNADIFSKAIDEVSPFLCCLCAVFFIIILGRMIDLSLKESRLYYELKKFVTMEKSDMYNLGRDELETLGAIIFRDKGFNIIFGDGVQGPTFTAYNLYKRIFAYVYKTPVAISVKNLKDFVKERELNLLFSNVIIINNKYTVAAKEYAELNGIQLLGVSELYKLLGKLRENYEDNG